LHEGVVWPQFAELHIEGNGFGALRREFFHQPAIDLSGPFKAVLVSQPPALDGCNTGILNGNEGKIGRHRRGKMQGRSRAQVVGHPLQALKKIEPQQANDANAQKNRHRQKGWRPLDGLELHSAGLNEKPEQLKAALALSFAARAKKNQLQLVFEVRTRVSSW
jgi:hypothetical protein